VSHIDAAFARLRASGERALMPYFSAGVPSLEVTPRLVLAAERAGADLVELGVPFSDPIADGPVIQRGSAHGLAAGATLPRVLEMVAGLRGTVRIPLLLMGYYNPIFSFGLKAFARAAVEVGVHGVIVPDLPPEEADELAAAADLAGLDLVHLVAPTSTAGRVRLIARRSRGFVYLVSLTGVTGERPGLPADLAAQIRAVRRVTTKPVCVGFGIGRPEQVRAVGALADGVIVGSAIMRLIEERATRSSLVDDVAEFIAALKAPLRERP
jgi:tryptophan synthase alpha chain